jgi:maltooligosyltrehalose trehalohydrolase
VTELRVWAPSAQRVRALVGGERRDLQPGGDSWWSAPGRELAHGTDYGFLIDDDETALPDPRSPWQPHGVHGLSRAYDESGFTWSDELWAGRQLAGAVIYELHIGTFTEGGTFDAAIERLDHLADLGVDVVEVMPVAAFPGPAGWGYDGVHLYAVHEPYGGPDGFKRFVTACHERGLAVCLDVVYNHVGPSGNYLPRFGPYFSDKHHTPWGQGVNLDDEGSAQVRRWVIDNALRWLRDFHVDALRLDAVHALEDDSPLHLLAELAREVDALSTALGRPLALIAESDVNQPSTVLPVAAGGLGMTAQWSDDLHHALHALLTGEDQGYYADFATDPYAAVERTLTGAFFHAGTHSSFRGSTWGAPVDRGRVPGWHFLGYVQTHDQVGNRAVGERIGHLTSPGLAKVGAALYLTSAFTPMLFMGEEWSASTPWQYFTAHEDAELADAVREGRRREFAEHGWAAEDVPDPQSAATVAASTLQWSEVTREAHAEMLEWHRELIRLRKAEPELSDPRLDRVHVTYDAAAGWLVVRRGSIRVACNLATTAQRVPLEGTVQDVLAASTDSPSLSTTGELPGESVAVVRLAG